MSTCLDGVVKCNARHPLCAWGRVSFDKKTVATKSNSLHRRSNGKKCKIYLCPKSDTWHLNKRSHLIQHSKAHAEGFSPKNETREIAFDWSKQLAGPEGRERGPSNGEFEDGNLLVRTTKVRTPLRSRMGRIG